jgi:RNA polymerase-binding transcription factor DksA
VTDLHPGFADVPGGADSGVADPAFAGDAALLDEVDSELGAVDTALRRLDEGTYFACEICGAGLDRAALERDPLITRCAQHAG